MTLLVGMKLLMGLFVLYRILETKKTLRKRTSLKDIAKEVGVSATLVSYVVNNREKEGRVGKEMAEKIRAVAERLNYRPNLIAKGLRSSLSKTIGLIIADISNPFFSNLARIIEDEASKNGYTLIIGSSDEKLEKMERLLDYLTSRQVDGFIIAPTEKSEAQIESLIKYNTPFVLIDRNLQGLSCNCVMTDNFNASKLGVEYLLKKKYQKIGVVAYSSTLHHYLDRVGGYRHALNAAGIEINENFVKNVNQDNLNIEVNEAVENLIHVQKVEAIFFTTNSLALKGLKSLHDFEIRVPTDVDVLAFDYNEIFDFFPDSISYIVQPISDIGTQAVKIVLDQIENESVSTVRSYLKGNLVTE